MTDSANKSAKIILDKVGVQPIIALTLGSGLGDLVEILEHSVTIPYHTLPDFPPCSVAGHAGNLIIGQWKNVPVAFLQGRAHFYEGVSNAVAKTYIRTMKLIGCEKLLLTNAAGSMRKNIVPGDLVLIKDHINFQFTNVLVGQNDDEFGERFTGMEDAYDPELRNTLLKIAKQKNITLHEGVYFGVLGPSFETPAEIRAFQTLGGDVVAMSLINEVITARHCGLRVAAISAISNMAAGLSCEKISHELTLSGAKKAAGQLKQLVMEFISQK
ncbi:MAG: purine-nucleoside phosphorylase [Gammaproteobacteria bacterium RIFCSPLOWO2_02_FULL_42_14]|nr:MAG: purine-nucleoside phosphorylase [Gammaproteobacteria bacterium RIFCSPHIGHO2_02_FULL_42_43]OGT51526.1 MAG: purine-nucleoside phosphorylase [Gammaproteobacteria bacterium RIFCSPHIGHO2_12_FULL_41_25]OGT62227.1 MAG: purine-nucleoside phosphorylase [Gammaproteobacteria bacterium RIFCSPLOWO2_02_FULL_42_14]OGT85900.1 MAG: purine-nucleoside phosphorylase [Gammaproteobacteria bacterium RIFCSPLOWO2_12_FULL_42_18]